MILFSEFNNCYPDPCVNGTCKDGHNTYTCSCFDGYKGTDCDGKSSELSLELSVMFCNSKGCSLF